MPLKIELRGLHCDHVRTALQNSITIKQSQYLHCIGDRHLLSNDLMIKLALIMNRLSLELVERFSSPPFKEENYLELDSVQLCETQV